MTWEAAAARSCRRSSARTSCSCSESSFITAAVGCSAVAIELIAGETTADRWYGRLPPRAVAGVDQHERHTAARSHVLSLLLLVVLQLQLTSQRHNQGVEFALHNAAQLIQAQADAMVGDSPLREIIGAYALRAIA